MRTGPRAAARASRGGERGLHSSGGASYTLGYSRVLPKSAPPAYPGGGAKVSDLSDLTRCPHPGESYTPGPTRPRRERSGRTQKGAKDTKQRTDCREG